jgi:hypothetical protein
LAFACVGSAPEKDIAAPNISRLSLFFPIDGLVAGRGESDTFADESVNYAYVVSHPSRTQDAFPLDENRELTFSIGGAVSGDVIEIAGMRVPDGADADEQPHGESVYIRVPARVPQSSRFFCCLDTKLCVKQEDFDNAEGVCPRRDQGPMTDCLDDAGCRDLNDEILPIQTDLIQVTPPDKDGLVQISGTVGSPGALVRLENRGKRGIGGFGQNTAKAVISDSNGGFRVRNILARGDDELVVQTYDLLGNRSPEAPFLVPDAPLVGLDVIGAYGYGRLVENQPGNLVIRVHPYGVDGRGICPNSTSGPTLCFTGGLTREMVTIQSAQLNKIPLNLRVPDPLPAGVSTNIATEGDPLKLTQSIVLVMDLSAEAARVDSGEPARFESAWRFVQTLRKRDQLGIVTFGSPDSPMGNGLEKVGVRREVELRPIADNYEFFRTYIRETLRNQQSTGAARPLQAIDAATQMLTDRREQGTIVLITMSDQVGDDPMKDDFDGSDAFDALYPKVISESTNVPIHTVYAVGVGQPLVYRDANNPNVTTPSNWIVYTQSIAEFSQGRAFNVRLVPEIDPVLDKLAGIIGGSYSLLFSLNVPCTGKNPDMDLQVSVAFGNATAEGTYTGSIRVDAASDPEECQ